MARYAQHHQTHFFQYPSPTAENFTDSAIGSEIINDPQSRLQTRWDELQRRITRASLTDDTVTAIEKSLDHISNLLSCNTTGRETEEMDLEIGLGISGVEISDSDYTAESSTTPTVPIAPEAICRPQAADETAAQSQALLERVTRAVEQLRHREEEFRVSDGRRRNRITGPRG